MSYETLMGDHANKWPTVAVLAVVAVLFGAGIATIQRGEDTTIDEGPVPGATTVPEAETGDIEVHVAGWVVSPGVVTVRDGAIVADAVDAAGGLRLGARTDALNLAAPLAAGDQVVVSGPGDSSADPTGSESTPGDGPLSLNRATASDLETLPGVGPVLAERIVSHREARGGFEQVEDLLEVPGIGEAKLAAIRDLVRP